MTQHESAVPERFRSTSATSWYPMGGEPADQASNARWPDHDHWEALRAAVAHAYVAHQRLTGMSDVAVADAILSVCDEVCREQR